MLPFANAEMMNLHHREAILRRNVPRSGTNAEIGRHITPGAHAVLTVDGAGWHQLGGRLQVPPNVTLLHLPPYAPELNPVETICAFLRGNKLSNRVFDTYDTVVDACCDAWTWLMDQPERVTSITSCHWACVS